MINFANYNPDVTRGGHKEYAGANDCTRRTFLRCPNLYSPLERSFLEILISKMKGTFCFAAVVAVAAAAKWPHPRQGQEHVDTVPASFDCAMRKVSRN